ncbi:Uncharacterised protein [Candidatus Anstonella stagnisolia]|nr:Uncharacterised protein [Candidatus Anstonella stagnisolia]
MRRGQASLEQLIITGIALFIVAMIFYFSINYARDSSRIAQGKDAVEKLAKSADYVHALGEGAKTRVDLYIPEGVEFVNASGGRIQMRISLSSGETDVFANTQAALVGEIPIISGANQVSVATTANGNVMFGEDYISCSPSSVVRSFVQGGSGNDSVVVGNIADFTISGISANLSGEAAGLVSLGSYASSLGAGNSTSVPLGFSIPSNQAVGTYGATLVVSASNFSECSTQITVSVSSSFGPDTQGPVVTSVTHFPASPNNATAIVVNASATEVGVGNGTISLCQLQIDASGVWNDMGGTYGQTTASTTYSIGPLATGAHNVSVRCVDSSGNVGNLSSDSFVVIAAAETQGPVVTLIAVYDSQAAANVSTTANENTVGTATCPAGKQISVWSSVYGTNCPINNASTCSSCTIGAASCSVNFSNAACGFDPCFGTFKQGQINLTCSPSGLNTSTALTLYASASDASTGGSNISLCEFSLDGGAFTAMNAVGSAYNTSVTQSANYSVGAVAAGTHNVSVRCTDSYGNLGNASSYSFSITFVDSQGPVVTLISSAPANATTLTSVVVNATASDNATGGSNISICQLRLDGGNFSSMNASGTAYNTSVTQNVSYTLGLLSAGTHNVSIRCNDTAGNQGNATNYTFNVTFIDTVGPIVSLITSTPSNARTGDSVRINATGNDTATGGSNITMCQLSLNGGAFGNMNVSSGAYNTSIVQNVNYVLGTLAAGTHNVSVRCNDSAGNMGNASNYSFNVRQRKEIIFVTLVAAQSVDEARWLSWIGNHSSNASFNWTRDVVTIANVTNGDVNMSEYRIIAMAEYPAADATYDALVNASRNAGHYIGVFGDGVANGVPRLGAGTGAGATANRAALNVRASHYVTAGFTVGNTYTILSSSQSINYHTAFSGTSILSMDNNFGRIVVGNSTRFIMYGPSRPDLFVANGDTFGVRVLDFALNNSVQG